MTNEPYHLPVLLHESVEGLDIQPKGNYVDVTFGGGGHSKAILEQLGEEGRLIAFDQDADAAQNLIKDDRLEMIRENFRHLKRFLRLHKALPVDGIIADLGISSHQIDTADRGFAIRYDAALDMRMDQDQKLTAADLLNGAPEEELVRIFSAYGEVRNSKTLAAAIVAKRKEAPLEQIEDLRKTAGELVIGNRNRYLAQVFQAVRIAVNGELDVLKELLHQSAEVLRPGGRLVVITYHSLEDRLVKQFITHGQYDREPVKDFYGKAIHPFNRVNKKPIIPTADEQKENPRSRSAKLRIGLRNETKWPIDEADLKE